MEGTAADGQSGLSPPQLEGQVLRAGTEILRIDPLDYELKLVQAQADLKSSQTSLAKLTLKKKILNRR